MNPQPLLDHIAQHVRLTPEEEALLLAGSTYHRYLKGQFCLQQGDICRYESFVLSGCLRRFYADSDGKEHVLRFSIENSWVGDWGSFISQTPADYNIQCLEITQLIRFSRESLENLYLTIPRLERFFRIILQQALIECEKRLVRNFSLSARERYGEFRQEFPQLEQRVPQYMVASYLGISKEFLSKIRNRQPG